MRTTDAAIVDPSFRLWRQAISISTKIESRLEWYKRNYPERVQPQHEENAAEILKLTRLVITGEIPACKIERYFTRRVPPKNKIGELIDAVFEGLPPPKETTLHPLEKFTAEIMHENKREADIHQHYFTLMCEVAYRAHHNWYMIFNTLTMAPGNYNAIFGTDGNAFPDYIRKSARKVAQAAYGSIHKAQHELFHTYFAVCENGGKNDRLHIHTMQFLRQPPIGATDPNAGLVDPRNRELLCLKNLWPYGRSEPRIVRYSPTDAWGRLGYRWPTDAKTGGQPLQIQSPLAVATYLAGYINKSQQHDHKEQFKWRVKKSHKLGHQLVKAILVQLTTKSLLATSAIDNLYLTLNNQQIPMPLLRQTALRLLSRRLSTKQHNEWRDGLGSLTTLAKHTTPRLSPLHCLRASTQTIHENSQLSTGYLKTVGLSPEATFDAAYRELARAADEIDRIYFPASIRTWAKGNTADTQHNTARYHAGEIVGTRHRVPRPHQNAGSAKHRGHR